MQPGTHKDPKITTVPFPPSRNIYTNRSSLDRYRKTPGWSVIDIFQSKRPVAKLYLVYYNLWAVAGTDTRLFPRSRPALPDPV